MRTATITFFNLGTLLLAILLGQNWNTNATFDQQIQDEVLAETRAVAYNHKAVSEETSLEELGITLHPGTEYKPESNGSPRSLSHCKSLVYRTLKSLPEEPVKKLKHLTLYFSESGRRGLGGGNTIILRCQNVTDEELAAVLVHEMGHIMDTGVMEGSWTAGESQFVDGSKPIYKNDPSLGFYTLSFKNDTEVKWSATKYDFVSGYAMTDPFEDFAESYAYYILHGKEFRELAQDNDILERKYNYLKTRVFKGKEYESGEENVDEKVRHFDVTVLPYNMKEFFIL